MPPHTGIDFRSDNIFVFGVIKEVLRNTVGEPWISDHESSRNGRLAFIALTTRYLGERQSTAIAQTAHKELESRYYNGKNGKFTLSKLIDVHKRCHDDIAQHDDDGPLSDQKKVRLLCNAIRDNRLRPTCDIVRNSTVLSRDFDSAAAVLQESVGIYQPIGSTSTRVVGATARGGGRGRGGRGRGGRGRGGRGRGGGRGSGRGEGFIPSARWQELQAERRRIMDQFNERVQAEREGRTTTTNTRAASSAATNAEGGESTETTDNGGDQQQATDTPPAFCYLWQVTKQQKSICNTPFRTQYLTACL